MREEEKTLKTCDESQEPLLSLRQVSKSFTQAGQKSKLSAVDQVSLDLYPGEIVGIIGFSGAGKSTLLRMTNLLERPDQGQVIFKGQDLCALSPQELRLQRREIAMIFQDFNLFWQRSVEDNVIYPLRLAGIGRKPAQERAHYLLELVGLKDKIKARPASLSGGQKQRVAIARALANQAELLLSDEATSALDPSSKEEILQLLIDLRDQLGLSILLITHQMEVVNRICDRVALMEKGKIVEAGAVKTIFKNPQSTVSKSFILPKGALLTDKTGEFVLRLSFDGQESSLPLFAQMVLDTGVAPSILSADSHVIEGRSYGQLLVQLPDNKADQARVIDWLNLHHVSYEI